MDRQRQRKLLSSAQADKLSSASSWVQGSTVLYQTISSSTVHNKVGFLAWYVESHLGTWVVQIPQESSIASPQPTNTHQYPHTHLSQGANTHHSNSRDTITEKWMLAKDAKHQCGVFLFILGFFWHGLPYPTSGSQHRCLRLEVVKTPWASFAVNSGCRIQSHGLTTLLL